MFLTRVSAITISLLFVHCGIGFVDPATDPLLTPVTNAGSDFTVQAELTGTLDGSESFDQKGHAITYSWVQTSGTEVTLSDSSSSTTTFTAPSSPTTLEFQLTVANAGYSSTDTVTVSVITDPTLKGPFSDLSANNIQLGENKSLSNESIATTRESPYEANELTVTGTVTSSSGAMFIRCNKLILNSGATFSVDASNGASVVGSATGGNGGAGNGSGGGGGGGATAGPGGAGGSDGAGTAGTAGPQTGGSAGSRTGSSYTSGYTYGSGGNGGAGEAGVGAAGAGGSGFDGGGAGGGGGGGGSGGGGRGGGGGGGGGGLIIIICNSIEGTGTLSAEGGSGGTTQLNAGDGGGGGGGVIWTSFGTYSNQFTASVSGGTSTSGTAGSDGTAVIEDFNGDSQSYSGSW